MAYWDPGEKVRPQIDDWHDIEVDTPDMSSIEFTVTDNPVIAELLGPDGEPIRQWRQRLPFGYARG